MKTLFSFSVTLSLIIYQLLCHLISLSSTLGVPNPYKVLPPQPAVVSGILSGQSAAKYGPFKLAPGDYVLFMEWITPGIPMKTSLVLVSTNPDLQPSEGVPLLEFDRFPQATPWAWDMWHEAGRPLSNSNLKVKPADNSPDGLSEYMLVLGDNVRFCSGRMCGGASYAEVRFWVFDRAQVPRGPGRGWGAQEAWFIAAGGSATSARSLFNLPASAGSPGTQTGADLLLEFGLARAP